MAKLIRNGHSDVYEYGFSFFVSALEEYEISKLEAIHNSAVASRGATLENDDFDKFLDQLRVKKKKKIKEDHHKANIDMLNTKLG